jgi:hypothetical protein
MKRDHHFQQFMLLRAYLLQQKCVNSVVSLWFLWQKHMLVSCCLAMDDLSY